MASTNIVDLCSDDELGEVDVVAVKLELEDFGASMQPHMYLKSEVLHQKLKLNASSGKQDSEEIKSSTATSNGQSGISILDQELSPVDNMSLCSTSPICSAPICRQFWKAGNYDDDVASRSTLQNGKNYLNIHPKFLHSNATSHKWAFGAIAELLDNAVDEIQNGATHVIVDKTSNPRDGSPILLIQDDGGGMDPDAMRQCMSFGFSDKKSKGAIGQYGNGFKTSSMRLGADVIVFSRHMENKKLTQSIGLLSYTFLTQAGYDRIVVPMVDYVFNTSTGTFDALQRSGKEYFESNLSMMLQWSPYSSEAELLKQFEDIGRQGTKLILYNLWLNEDGTMELDFKSDPEDILLPRDAKGTRKATSEHLASRLGYSLRAYLSILYLRIPESFSMILRGRTVEYHNIANDLKFPEFILYRPHSGGNVEGTVVTTIGFLKEAPNVNVHGFNVYHKNRLILPYWHVVSINTQSRGRGVVGVLEANFVEPTHNKQDFEKTSVFQKLEYRLKEMTFEYWDLHCELIGYQPVRKLRSPAPAQGSADSMHRGTKEPVVLNKSSSAIASSMGTVPAVGGILQHVATVSSVSTYGFVARPGQSIPKFERNSEQASHLKRKESNHFEELRRLKRNAGTVGNVTGTGSNQPVAPVNQLESPEARNLLQKNKKLYAQCLEHEKREEELNFKVTQLRKELEAVRRVYTKLWAESQLLNRVKGEHTVNK